MSFTGIKSAGTILGSHEWQLDKLENFAITFWEKPTFNSEAFYHDKTWNAKKVPFYWFNSILLQSVVGIKDL